MGTLLQKNWKSTNCSEKNNFNPAIVQGYFFYCTQVVCLVTTCGAAADE